MRPLIAGAVLACAWLQYAKGGRAEPAPPLRPAAPPATSGLERGPYVHTFGALSYGRGLRFNNPFRLQTELGDDAESLSLTSGYLDLGLGAVLGDPHGLQHGAVVHLSLATNGVSQQVLSLSYQAVLPLTRDLLGMARGGLPVVLTPDLGLGLEVGAGVAYLVSGGLGMSAELVSSLFFGAATWEHDPNLFPVVSLQLGAFIDYEVLP